jgi:haloalkane dehalogenase
MSILEKTIAVGKWEWFYRETPGSNPNPPVLLLHGIPAHSLMWRGIMERAVRF